MNSKTQYIQGENILKLYFCKVFFLKQISPYPWQIWKSADNTFAAAWTLKVTRPVCYVTPNEIGGSSTDRQAHVPTLPHDTVGVLLLPWRPF
jgi:hypothetical protein